MANGDDSDVACTTTAGTVMAAADTADLPTADVAVVEHPTTFAAAKFPDLSMLRSAADAVAVRASPPATFATVTIPKSSASWCWEHC